MEITDIGTTVSLVITFCEKRLMRIVETYPLWFVMSNLRHISPGPLETGLPIIHRLSYCHNIP